jgi:hypothetical protein
VLFLFLFLFLFHFLSLSLYLALSLSQARNVCLLAKYGNLYVNEEKKCADQGGSCVCDGNVRFGADGFCFV